MVERARQALADRPNSRVFATSGRLDRFRDESVDFVYSYAVFQHVPSHRAVRQYMAEAARILKARGVFRFQVDGRPRNRLTRTDTWLGVWYEPQVITRELSAPDSKRSTSGASTRTICG